MQTKINDNFEFIYTALKEPVIIHKDAPCADAKLYSVIWPRKFTSQDLRDIADFMDNNPNCRLMEDGSGSNEIKYIS